MDVMAVAALMFEAGVSQKWRRADCVVRWSSATRALEASGLLRTIGLAGEAPCSACRGVHEIEGDGEGLMHCPVAGKVAVQATDLVQVTFDESRWLDAVGAALALPAPEPVLPGFLWCFKRQQAAGWRKQIWIARGLGAHAVFDEAARALKAAGRRAKWLLTGSNLPREAGAALGAEIIRFADCGVIADDGRLALDLEVIVGRRKRSKEKGKPGRKAKVGPARDLFRKRLAEGVVLPVLVAEAKSIHAALAPLLKPEELPRPHTIEDAIRDDHAKTFSRPRPVKP